MTSQPTQENILLGVGYGLGTMVFLGLSTDTTYGHLGASNGYTTLSAVTPERRPAIAVLIPEGGRRTDSIVRDLLAVLQ